FANPSSSPLPSRLASALMPPTVTPARPPPRVHSATTVEYRCRPGGRPGRPTRLTEVRDARSRNDPGRPDTAGRLVRPRLPVHLGDHPLAARCHRPPRTRDAVAPDEPGRAQRGQRADGRGARRDGRLAARRPAAGRGGRPARPGRAGTRVRRARLPAAPRITADGP